MDPEHAIKKAIVSGILFVVLAAIVGVVKLVQYVFGG
jgi:hypothetical protein